MFLSWASILGVFGCNSSPEQKQLIEIRDLIDRDRRHPQLPDTGRHIPENVSNGSFSLIAGVWVEDRLYYQALGVPLGKPPKGEDVRDLHPGIPDQVFGRCGRCNRSWKWVKGHATNYTESSGCFPLCDSCWKALTPEQRLPFYRKLFDGNTASIRGYDGGEYLAHHLEEWPLIEKAVLEGK